MQLYTFSCFGTKLQKQSVKIAETVYDISWYNNSLPLKKFVCLIMIRAQRPMGISAAKFYFISLESFAKVCFTCNFLQTFFKHF